MTPNYEQEPSPLTPLDKIKIAQDITKEPLDKNMPYAALQMVCIDLLKQKKDFDSKEQEISEELLKFNKDTNDKFQLSLKKLINAKPEERGQIIKEIKKFVPEKFHKDLDELKKSLETLDVALKKFDEAHKKFQIAFPMYKPGQFQKLKKQIKAGEIERNNDKTKATPKQDRSEQVLAISPHGWADTISYDKNHKVKDISTTDPNINMTDAEKMAFKNRMNLKQKVVRELVRDIEKTSGGQIHPPYTPGARPRPRENQGPSFPPRSGNN